MNEATPFYSENHQGTLLLRSRRSPGLFPLDRVIERLKGEDDLLERRAMLARCISSQGRPQDEIIVECDEADADAVMGEVQAFMETRSAQVFNGQKIGVEAHIEDNWGGANTDPKHDVALFA